MKLMKAIAVTDENVVKVVDDVPVPEMGEYEALCVVRACGFCSGTDFQIIHGKTGPQQGFVGYPTILGHEGVGEVIAVGAKVRNIQVGDRYLRTHLHADVGNGYTKTYGSMAQYGVVCDQKAMVEDGVCSETEVPFYKRHCPFPKSISFADAGVLLSLSESYTAADNFGTKPGDRVLIYGAGPMGTALGLFMRLRGAEHITYIDGIEERLENTKRIVKAERTINFTREDPQKVLGSEQFDLIVDAVGKSSILVEGSQRAKPGGKVCSMGVLKSNDLLVNMGEFKNHACLHMLNFPYQEYERLPEVIDLVTRGVVNPKDFYSHVVPFEEIHEAMRLVQSREAFKVVLDFGGCEE